MAWVEVDNVSVDIPIFDSKSVSFKARAATLFKRLGGFGGHGESCEIVHALRNVSFHLKDGDRVGLIGRNGCGKTTLLRTVAGIYEPTAGQVRVAGQTCAILDLMLGMDMDATGIENIYLRAYAVGISRKEISNIEREIADFTELGAHLKYPVRTYSAGMVLRLAFSASLIAPHEIMLLDEVIGVGDASFIQKARARLDDVIARSRIVVVASHSVELLESMCNKGIYLRDGCLVEFASIQETVAAYRRDIAVGAA
jgi:ABC-2 type transport system ATP-binding protein/lipopolysaccharide transport system ATP-binding protein